MSKFASIAKSTARNFKVYKQKKPYAIRELLLQTVEKDKEDMEFNGSIASVLICTHEPSVAVLVLSQAYDCVINA